jgi:hypothetical protein
MPSRQKYKKNEGVVKSLLLAGKFVRGMFLQTVFLHRGSNAEVVLWARCRKDLIAGGLKRADRHLGQ